MALVINRELTTEDIKDQDGNVVGTMVYDKNDLGILSRYDEKKSSFPRAEDIQGLTMQEANGKYKDIIDYIFGNGFYDNAFSTIHPLTMVEGKPFCIIVITHVLQQVNEKLSKNREAIEKKKSKYMKAYEK